MTYAIQAKSNIECHKNFFKKSNTERTETIFTQWYFDLT